jgi:hypothetical protein
LKFIQVYFISPAIERVIDKFAYESLQDIERNILRLLFDYIGNKLLPNELNLFSSIIVQDNIRFEVFNNGNNPRSGMLVDNLFQLSTI